MKHKMKLQPEFYNYMKNGTKRIEIRLNDEKRKLIHLKDTISFLKEPNLEESFDALVINLYHYNSFKEMFENFDISILADVSYTKEKLLEELEKYYSKEKQKQYGVLAIEVELI